MDVNADVVTKIPRSVPKNASVLQLSGNSISFVEYTAT